MRWVLQQKMVRDWVALGDADKCLMIDNLPYPIAVFSAYIYYVVSPAQYERVTSYVKASALVASLLSGVLGDLVSHTYTYIHTYMYT